MTAPETDAPTIAERTNPRTGRIEYRAYPAGRSAADGGSGPWTPDRDQAEGILADALAVDAARAEAEPLAAALRLADHADVVRVRDEATSDMWRAVGDQRRQSARARHTVAQAELDRRSDTVTGYAATGRTAHLTFRPGHPHGSAWVSLDRDPGIGSMTYPDSIEAWTITGGNPQTVDRIAAWAADRIQRAPWVADESTPGGRAFRAWAHDVVDLAAELTKPEETVTNP